MFRKTFAVTAIASALALTGCQAGATFDPGLGRGATAQERAQLAAYAASVQYPRDIEASDDLRAAALIDRRANTIRILNFSDRPIRDAAVWVNGSFVHRVDVIPANGSVTVRTSELYDSSGRSMAATAMTATTVQLQANEELYNLQGPVFDQ